jgi:hypothetical protein
MKVFTSGAGELNHLAATNPLAREKVNTQIRLVVTPDRTGCRSYLSHHLAGRPKRPGCNQLLVDVLRQGLPRFEVPGEAHESRLVVAPVLHELARQLHRVPLHVPDARNETLVLARQHVLRAER